MELFIKKQIGKNIYNFVVHANNLHELTMESQKLSFSDVKKCGWCESDDLILNARKAEGFEYTEVKCLCCQATLTFGRMKKDKDVFYLRKNDDRKYDWRQYNAPEVKTQTKYTKTISTPVEYSH